MRCYLNRAAPYRSEDCPLRAGNSWYPRQRRALPARVACLRQSQSRSWPRCRRYASAGHGDEVTASLTTGCTIGTLAAALNARSLRWLSDRGGSVAVVVARTEARGAARRLGADDRVELGAE
jgi:hypothetical protein